MGQISIEHLEGSVKRILRNSGYPESQLSVLLDVILYATLRGNFQFIIQVCAGNFPPSHAQGEIEITHETPLSIHLNGNHNYGIAVMERSMRLTIQKAKQAGFAISSSSQSAPPGTGPLGYYVEKIALEGLIGFAFSGSGKQVAAYGSHFANFGSNPIGIGFPTLADPLVIDMATSATPVYKVVEASLLSQTLQEAGFDAQGEPSNDPLQVLKGAIRAFGGHKGSALALAVEVLTAPLAGGSWHKDGNDNWGNLIFAIDPGLLIRREIFLSNISELIGKLRHHSPTLPGDLARRTFEQALKQGYIELDDILFGKWNQELANI